MKKILKDNRGFTIIETMIALSFFTIAMLGAAALYIGATKSNTLSNLVSSANFLAKTTLEEYKNLPLTDSKLADGANETSANIDEFGGSNGIFTRVIKVSNISGDSNARQIVVTVTWPGRAQGAGGTRDSDRVELISNVRGGL